MRKGTNIEETPGTGMLNSEIRTYRVKISKMKTIVIIILEEIKTRALRGFFALLHGFQRDNLLLIISAGINDGGD
jgi:hypothetical protein